MGELIGGPVSKNERVLLLLGPSPLSCSFDGDFCSLSSLCAASLNSEKMELLALAALFLPAE